MLVSLRACKPQAGKKKKKKKIKHTASYLSIAARNILLAIALEANQVSCTITVLITVTLAFSQGEVRGRISIVTAFHEDTRDWFDAVIRPSGCS